MENNAAVLSLVAGGMAGLSVDLTLYPLDTVKTRLQSSSGFFKSGGFRGIYSGLPAVAIGSVPGAGVFFLTYDSIKKVLEPRAWSPVAHMTAASFGEVAACIIRVPVEVVKQRTQANQHTTTWRSFALCIKVEGLRGLYRGYFSTVVREIPFSLIQFPLWEGLKRQWYRHQGSKLDPWQGAVCGCVAGGISAAVTTPLDVAKTRIILAEKSSAFASGQIIPVLQAIWLEKGFRGLFAGVLPRVVGISAGGAIFLGAYEKTKSVLTSQ